MNTHRHDNIKSRTICPFYHVSFVSFPKNVSISRQKRENFDSWQWLCVLTCLSNKWFVINNHHHHRTSSIKFIFLAQFIHLPPCVTIQWRLFLQNWQWVYQGFVTSHPRCTLALKPAHRAPCPIKGALKLYWSSRWPPGLYFEYP
jgi:hypothetical protein